MVGIAFVIAIPSSMAYDELLAPGHLHLKFGASGIMVVFAP